LFSGTNSAGFPPVTQQQDTSEARKKQRGKKEKERSRKQLKREKAGQEREEGNCRRRRAEEARKPLCGRREPARKKVLFPFKI
jgi:hypothetical protein